MPSEQLPLQLPDLPDAWPLAAGQDLRDINSGNSSEAITDRPRRAMLVEPPDVDHNDEGLQMSSPLTRKRAEWKVDGVEDERRQDSGHAEK